MNISAITVYAKKSKTFTLTAKLFQNVLNSKKRSIGKMLLFDFFELQIILILSVFFIITKRKAQQVLYMTNCPAAYVRNGAC